MRDDDVRRVDAITGIALRRCLPACETLRIIDGEAGYGIDPADLSPAEPWR